MSIETKKVKKDKAPKKKQSMFLKNIMAGVGGFVPIALTVSLFWAFILKVDYMVIGHMVNGVIEGGLPDKMNPGFYAPVLYEFPGVGLLAVVAVLFFGGVLIRTWLGNKIKTLIHYLMEQVPFVGSAFKMIKKVIDQVTAQEQNAPEKKAVWVEHLRDDVYAPAFSLGYSTMFVSPHTGLRLQVVYFPSAPNPTSGWIILVPDHLVHDAHVTADVMMELILSCGFSQTKVEEYMSKMGGQQACITATGELVTQKGVVELVDDQIEQPEPLGTVHRTEDKVEGDFVQKD